MSKMRVLFTLFALLSANAALADDLSIYQIDSKAVSLTPPRANAENVKLEDSIMQQDYQQNMLSNPYANGYAQMQEISGTGPINNSSQNAEGDYAKKRLAEDELLSPDAHREIADSMLIDERSSPEKNPQLLGGSL